MAVGANLVGGLYVPSSVVSSRTYKNSILSILSAIGWNTPASPPTLLPREAAPPAQELHHYRHRWQNHIQRPLIERICQNTILNLIPGKPKMALVGGNDTGILMKLTPGGL